MDKFAFAERVLRSAQVLQGKTCVTIEDLVVVMEEFEQSLKVVLSEFQNLHSDNSKLLENQKDWVLWAYTVKEKFKKRDWTTDNDDPRYDKVEIE